MSHHIRTVLCDIDGTLVDSNAAHVLAWLDALEAVGQPSSFDRIAPLVGMGADKLLPALGIEATSAIGTEIGERAAREFLEKYLADVKPFERVRELLERIRETKRIVAATSASDKETNALLHHAHIADLFESATSSDDVDESKPAPDIVVAALRRSNTKPNEAVMIGDTPYDVSAAVHANVSCIALRCGGHDTQALAGAIEIYDDAAAVLDAWSSSILGDHDGVEVALDSARRALRR